MDRCYHEAFELARALKEDHGVDLSNARLVIFHHPHFGKVPIEEAQILGRNTKSPLVQEWSMHVVLVLDGKVLDIYYRDQEALPSVSEYMNMMWKKEYPVDSRMRQQVQHFDPEAEIRVRVFSADEVVRQPVLGSTSRVIDIRYYLGPQARPEADLSFNQFITTY